MKTKTYKKGKSLASKVEKLSKKVALIKTGIEKKYSEYSATGLAIDNNPSFYIQPYGVISVGDNDYNQRTGDNIQVTSVNLRGVLNLTAAALSRQCRIFAFIYKHNPDVAIPLWSTVVNMYLESAYMNGPRAPLAPYDHDNKDSFVTIYDQRISLNPQNGTTGLSYQINKYFKIPKKYRNVQYVAGTTGVSKNDLYIGILQEYDTGLTTDFVVRTNYTDA